MLIIAQSKPKDVFFSDGVGTRQIAKNIKAAAHKMVTAGTVTTGVSKKRAKVGQLVRVNILKLDSAQQAEDLKGFRKMYGINYLRKVYKVASIIPWTKAAGADEYLIAEAYKFVPENRKTGTKGYYLDLAKNGTTALLQQQFYWDELLVKKSYTHLYHVCTTIVPCLYHVCTTIVPQLYHACTMFVPRLYHDCTTLVLHL